MSENSIQIKCEAEDTRNVLKSESIEILDKHFDTKDKPDMGQSVSIKGPPPAPELPNDEKLNNITSQSDEKHSPITELPNSEKQNNIIQQYDINKEDSRSTESPNEEKLNNNSQQYDQKKEYTRAPDLPNDEKVNNGMRQDLIKEIVANNAFKNAIKSETVVPLEDRDMDSIELGEPNNKINNFGNNVETATLNSTTQHVKTVPWSAIHCTFFLLVLLAFIAWAVLYFDIGGYHLWQKVQKIFHNIFK